MARLEVQFFGRLQITHNGQVLTTFRTTKTQALLLYLLSNWTKPQQRSHLTDLLWPGLPEKSARANLRSTLYFARQLVGGVIATDGEFIQIDPALPVCADTATFSALIQSVEQHRHADIAYCADCEQQLLQSIALAIGDFADGFTLDDSIQFEDWIFVKRSSLKRSVLSAHDSLVDCLLAKSDLIEAAKVAQQRLTLDLHNEAGYRQVINVCLHTGKRSDGLQAYDRCRQMLESGWGIAPSAETEALVAQLRNGQRSPRVVIPAPNPVKERPFSAGPPVLDPKRFFGRSRELRRIAHWLENRPMSHIAIVGKRRSGKTSLLHQLQHKISEPRFVWIDFQDPRMRQLPTVLAHLLLGIGLPASDNETLASFMDKVVTHRWQQSIVVMMDELGAGLSAPALTQQFWWMLRALVNSAQASQLAFVVAAHAAPIMLAEEQQKTSPFFNVFSTLPLGPLTGDEATSLIDSGGGGFSAKDRQWILDQSQRWPILLQILCEECLYALENDEPAWRADALTRIEPYRYLLA